MGCQEPLQLGRGAAVDVAERLAARVAERGRVLHEAVVTLRLAGADRTPVEPLPAADVALRQRQDRLGGLARKYAQVA